MILIVNGNGFLLMIKDQIYLIFIISSYYKIMSFLLFQYVLMTYSTLLLKQNKYFIGEHGYNQLKAIGIGSF